MAPNDVLGLLVAATAAVAILRGPVGKALGRWIESWGRTEQAFLDAQAGPDHRRLAELEQRMTELEAREGRLAELEERLDFAERLLAQRRDAAQLPQAGG
jgi:hypothetical protein